MSNIVKKINGNELVVSTFDIAEHTGIQHKNVLELLKNYLDDFHSFGRVAFETQPFETAGGVQKREVALLNENQSALLLTYMRNSDVVRVFKIRLVKEFSELKTNSFQIPTTLSGALMLAAKQAEQIEQQQALIEQQAPAVEFVERYVEARSNKSIREAAKVLGQPEKAFIQWLIDSDVLFRQGGNLLPHANYQHKGYFTVKTGEQHGHAFIQTRFTPEGIAWIAKRVSKKEAA